VTYTDKCPRQEDHAENCNALHDLAVTTRKLCDLNVDVTVVFSIEMERL